MKKPGMAPKAWFGFICKRRFLAFQLFVRSYLSFLPINDGLL